MYSQINVEGKVATIHVCSGWGSSGYVKLVGSTFPIVPAGTIVDKLSANVPDGLHATAFYCRVDGPRRMGSGKTAYLDDTPLISNSVLLGWEEDDKSFIRADKDMSAAELARFNSFVRSDTDVLVVDTDRRIVYAPDSMRSNNLDPMWTYKSVSMNTILEYITKKLTLEELDQRATSEQRARDELREIKEELGRMRAKVIWADTRHKELKTRVLDLEVRLQQRKLPIRSSTVARMIGNTLD